MKRQITSEETKKLFQFCHNHFVYQYDVQIELVDHLASSIEEQLEENPGITFEKALHRTYGKFGVTGFSKILDQKQKEMTKKYTRLLWKYIFHFYTWPKILLTLALTLGLIFIFQVSNSITWFTVPYFGLIIVGGLFYLGFTKESFSLRTVSGKRFMLLELLRQFQLMAILISQFPLMMYNIFIKFEFVIIDNLWMLSIFSLLIVGLNILLFGYFFYVPQKIKEHFYEQFAEFVNLNPCS